MKKMLLIGAVLLSQSAFATTSSEAVKSFEKTNGMTCTYTAPSDYQFCLNYLCHYKKYYSCVNKNAETTLVLEIKSIQIPGEAPENTVTNSYEQ